MRQPARTASATKRAAQSVPNVSLSKPAKIDHEDVARGVGGRQQVVAGGEGDPAPAARQPAGVAGERLVQRRHGVEDAHDAALRAALRVPPAVREVVDGRERLAAEIGEHGALAQLRQHAQRGRALRVARAARRPAAPPR